MVVKAPLVLCPFSAANQPPTKTVAATLQVRRGSPGDRHGVLSETDGGEYSIKAKYPPGSGTTTSILQADLRHLWGRGRMAGGVST